MRQGWMAWFIFNALQTSRVSVPEVAAMAICKLIYRYERKKRCDEGRRSEYGILHSFEHLDLYLYVSAALVPDIALRQADWINIVYLLLSACCVALVPIRHGDGCRACLGTIMIIFAD